MHHGSGIAPLTGSPARPDAIRERDFAMFGAILRLLLCFILPPLAVFVKRGFGLSFIFSVILTIAVWVPGVIYALYINFIAGD